MDLYFAVRNAYADKVTFLAVLAYKTRRLIEANAVQTGLGESMAEVTFDSKALEAARAGAKPKVPTAIGFGRRVRAEAEQNPVLLPLKERAEAILEDLQRRRTTDANALEDLVKVAAELEAAAKAAKESGLSRRAFAIAWTLQADPALADANIDAKALALEAERIAVRFPNAAVNDDERRQLRSALYKPLLRLETVERARIADIVADLLLRELPA